MGRYGKNKGDKFQKKLVLRVCMATVTKRSPIEGVCCGTDGGLTLDTSTLETLYGGQYTNYASSLKPNYLGIPSNESTVT